MANGFTWMHCAVEPVNIGRGRVAKDILCVDEVEQRRRVYGSRPANVQPFVSPPVLFMRISSRTKKTHLCAQKKLVTLANYIRALLPR